ncbi:DEAD/DEAH box helicase [Streptomyces sp. NA04227]|uniref:DEAD/DEAH box helicase n=1 Tax=Streptomyces sp. NA04227 TaxID=2742136 RepID=UPI00158FBC5D|nr:DEAD/DEAH box helicase [Streptomyces sp. NA04227]QKW11303.1 DEAD/DEAH box helicase [Streptomyces sp. NA04227]
MLSADLSADSGDSPDLAGWSAVFTPAEPARAALVHFWPSTADGLPGDFPEGISQCEKDRWYGTASSLDLVLPAPAGGLEVRRVATRALSIGAALGVLTRAYANPSAHPAARFWGAAALLALDLVARGRLLPGVSEDGFDQWRCAPLTGEDHARVLELAACAPPLAHCVPLDKTAEDLRLPDPSVLLRDFLDAVADTLPRTPAAVHALGGGAFAGAEVLRRPEYTPWAAALRALHDVGVRLSLRVEVSGLGEELTARATKAEGTGEAAGTGAEPRFRVVLQVHSADDPALVVDAERLWAAQSGTPAGFGPQVRRDVLIALRRAAHHWPPLGTLLSAPVPDSVELADDDVADLLGRGAQALADADVRVHWPRLLARGLSARAVLPGEHTDVQGESGASTGPAAFKGLVGADQLLSFRWQFALDDQDLTAAEFDRLAEAKRPLVRLGDRWVLVDPAQVARLRERRTGAMSAVQALGAALTGSAEIDGQRVPVEAAGRLNRLRELLTADEGAEGVPQPAALAAQLRDYQLRGLGWLARMTGTGLGCCLADDMGLGKTITLISLHLHRQQDPATAGPTLVVCPTSLMGNWEREIGRFAPGTPVRRHHGARRELSAPAAGEVVLTTYGTMRLDAERLGATPWGLVVADEAQHVKNPYSATARALRGIPAAARVALTGTPVENNLSELWAILDWTTPGLLGSLGAFRRQYAVPVEGGADPVAAERLGRLVRPFLLRRRKSDPGIAPELPPKTETDRAVALTAEQAALYEAVVREMLERISAADGIGRRGLIVKLFTSLKQICNHPAQYLDESDPQLSGRSGKLELLDELLDTMTAEGAGVLVFTQYVRMARLIEARLAERGIGAQFLHGGTPVAEREAMVARFQAGTVPVFLLSLKAAGTGLNLTRAEHVVHYDRWWNPAVEAQATDRAHRIGQTRSVQVHRLIAEGTVEDRIDAMLRTKQALADAVLGGGEAALTELSDGELAALVRLQSERSA